MQVITPHIAMPDSEMPQTVPLTAFANRVQLCPSQSLRYDQAIGAFAAVSPRRPFTGLCASEPPAQFVSTRMIDSHCHLTDPRLFNQLEDVLARAKAAGVSRLITIGTDIADSRAAIAACRGRDGKVRENLRCVIGVHPNYTQQAMLEELPVLRDLSADPAVVALGEMGLDYFHKFADRKHQAAMFEAQLAIAAEVGRAVVIHSREAIADTLAIMRNVPQVRAVFHCFTGTIQEADAILTADEKYLISFTGPITYKKNDALRAVVKRVPIERLMVETDAPYLSPEPMRAQKVNEPALVMYTAATVAEVKGMDLGEVDRVTTTNAQRFFGWV